MIRAFRFAGLALAILALFAGRGWCQGGPISSKDDLKFEGKKTQFERTLAGEEKFKGAELLIETGAKYYVFRNTWALSQATRGELADNASQFKRLMVAVVLDKNQKVK